MSLPPPSYQDDWITLYQGDSHELVPLLGQFDLLLTDPPYGLQKCIKGAGGRAMRQYREFHEWDSLPGNPIPFLGAAKKACVWGGNYFPLPPSRGWLIWNKIRRGNSFADAELAWTNLDRNCRCFDFHREADKHRYNKVHPTQKPIELFRWCLTHFPKTKTVIDPFAGSGAAGIACRQRGIRCVLIEREPRFIKKTVLFLRDTAELFPTIL